MGKNPNAKKLKERKHRERTYSNDIEDLEEDAARLGLTVLELQQQRQEEGQKSESNDEDSGSGDDKPVAKVAKKGKKQESSSDEEEEKVKPQKKPEMPKS